MADIEIKNLSDVDKTNIVLPGITNIPLIKGDKGDTGENGATFTPYVSDEGIISWNNDKNLPNPEPKNIKGEKGDKGEPGATYDDTEITNEIQKLKDNSINVTTDLSSNINVQDCSNLEGRIDVEGNSVQGTRSGKNLINVLKESLTTNGISFTNNKDGSVTINGTATGTAYFSMEEETFTLEKGKTYSAYLGGTKQGISMVARTLTSNTQLISLPDAQEIITSTYNGDTVTDAYTYIRIETGTTLNNITVYPMLVEGKEVGEYESYGTSPSPQYPSEIQNVEGNVDIIVCNKNLLKLYKYNSSITANGVTITINEDGTIKLNGTATSQSYIEVVENFKSGITLSDTKQFQLDISKKYMFSVKKKSGTYTASNFMFALQPTLEGTKNIVIYINSQSNASITNSDGIYRGWIAFPAGAVFNELVLEPQIEEGEVETEYTQHQSQTITFPLSEGQKLMKGDYLADDGIHHKRKQIEFDGTENWKKYLSQQKEAGTPIIVEYELDEEVIEPYTEEQQEAYNQLQSVLPYKLVTNIFTDLALLKFNYIADTKTYIDNKTTNIQNQINTINELLNNESQQNEEIPENQNITLLE